MEDAESDHDRRSNPQNAEEHLVLSSIKSYQHAGLQHINGVLVPAELARKFDVPKAPNSPCPQCRIAGCIRRRRNQEGLLQVTACEVRKHCTLEDCWITSRGFVYDASAFMSREEHPGGERAFLRRAGGIMDSSEDFAFHSSRGRRLWNEFRIAVLIPCNQTDENEWDNGCSIS